MVKYVAGTVDCVYPRPVDGDRLEDVIDFVFKNDDWEVGFIDMTNGFDADGNYVRMEFNGYKEGDGSVHGRHDPMFRDSYTGFSATMTKRWSHFALTQVQAPTIPELLEKVSKVSKGTMIVRFDDGYGMSRNCVKTFKVAVG